MRCPRCGHENPRGTTTCQGCKKVRFVSKSASASGVKKAPSKSKMAALPARSSVKPAPAKAAAPRPRPKSRSEMKTIAPVRPPAPRATGGSTAASRKKHLLMRVGAPPLEIDATKVFTIGRGPKCSLSIDSNRVSRVHAVIKLEGGKLVLSDRGSANGTFVGGKPVIDHTLAEGDEISIGPFTGTYRYADPEVAGIPPTFVGGATVIEKGDLIRGQLSGGALTEVLQGIEFHKKTGTLFVFSLSGQGWITFQDGLPCAAESGAWQDSEAVFQLLALAEGRFSFTSELRDQERRMKMPVTGLLLEWGRRADEGGK